MTLCHISYCFSRMRFLTWRLESLSSCLFDPRKIMAELEKGWLPVHLPPVERQLNSLLLRAFHRERLFPAARGKRGRRGESPRFRSMGGAIFQMHNRKNRTFSGKFRGRQRFESARKGAFSGIRDRILFFHFRPKQIRPSDPKRKSALNSKSLGLPQSRFDVDARGGSA